MFFTLIFLVLGLEIHINGNLTLLSLLFVALLIHILQRIEFLMYYNNNFLTTDYPESFILKMIYEKKHMYINQLCLLSAQNYVYRYNT